MGLDIESSNLGYDINNLSTLIQKLQIELIDSTIESISTGVQTLESNMPNYWIGDSSEAFRSKLEVDSFKLAQQFQSISRALESEIKQMIANVANSDSTVAASILGETFDIPHSSGTTNNITPDTTSDTTPELNNNTTDNTSVEEQTQEEVDNEADDIDVDVNEGSSTTGNTTVPTEETPETEIGEPPLPPEEEIGDPPLPPEEELEATQDGSFNSSDTPTPNPTTYDGTYGQVGEAENDGDVHSKGKASAEAKATNGVLTQGNQQYQVGETTDIANGQLSERDYIYLVSQVAGESANDTDDMLGVCTTILNRAESKPGSTIESVLAGGYWPWGETYRKYVNLDASGYPTGFKTLDQLGQAEYDKLQSVLNVVADAMNGTRNLNSNVIYYYGDSKHNYFSDIL